MSRKNAFIFSALLLISFAVLLGTAYALTYRPLSTSDLVKGADAICIGKCIKKSSRFVDHNIVTTVEIAVSEYIKGDLGKTITLAIIGGEIEEPLPLAQRVMGTPNFLEGEEVLLFLAAPKKGARGLASDPKSLSFQLASSPDVVGWFQGKYTILTDSVTGQKKVANFNFENMQIVPNDEITRKLYSALENTRKTEGDAAAAKLQKEIQNLLLISKEGTLGAQRQAITIAESQSKKSDKAEYVAPKIIQQSGAKIAKIDSPEQLPPRQAAPLQKEQSQPPKRVQQEAGTNLQLYFDTLESLESFKEKIKDTMAKQP
jgi:hypothetical protein